MVARSAYAQLNYSRPLLAVTTVAMTLTYLAAPVLAIFASYPANAVAAAAWALMTFVFLPILHFYRHVSALGRRFALDRRGLFGVHAQFGVPALAGQGRNMERAQSGPCSEAMTIAANIDASKTEHDENFPVASLLITPRLRVADLELLPLCPGRRRYRRPPEPFREQKFEGLDALEDTLLGKSDKAKAALPLRRVLAERGLAPTHPLDLLTAFRADVTKRRYANWVELMDYCRYSAMPVGRFVLDLHGEDEFTWAYSDPLCAALQVINHLQDCAKDYCALDRVYLPLDMMKAQGTSVEALASAKASPALQACLRSIASKAG